MFKYWETWGGNSDYEWLNDRICVDKNLLNRNKNDMRRKQMNYQIYPNCGNCNLCDSFCMKDECMDGKLGKKFKASFYNEVKKLKKEVKKSK